MTKVTAKDLLPDYQMEFLVEKLIPENFCNLCLGRPGRFKSWFLTDLAIAVVTGGKWMGRLQAKKGSVIYIDEDTPTNVLENRFDRLCYQKGIDWRKETLLTVRSMTGFQLDVPSDVKEIKTIAEYLNPPVLLIADCLDSMSGGLDLNHTPAAKYLGKILNSLKAAGMTLMVAHHLSEKGDSDQKILSEHKEFNRMILGNTKIVGDADTLFSLWQPIPKDPYFIVWTRQKKTSLDFPEKFGVHLREDDEHEWASLHIEEELRKYPSEPAILLTKVFCSKNGDTELTVKQMRESLQESLSWQETRDGLKELQIEKVLKVGKEAHNLHKYSLRPDWASGKSSYVGFLKKKC